jgi:hypothetical protein
LPFFVTSEFYFDKRNYLVENTRFFRIQNNKKACSCILIIHRNRLISTCYASFTGPTRGARGKQAAKGQKKARRPPPAL